MVDMCMRLVRLLMMCLLVVVLKVVLTTLLDHLAGGVLVKVICMLELIAEVSTMNVSGLNLQVIKMVIVHILLLVPILVRGVLR